MLRAQSAAVALAALGLSACLRPVAAIGGEDAASLDASASDAAGLDASEFDAGGADAGPLDGGAAGDAGLPDGAIACEGDATCPQPAPSTCTQGKGVCRSGACAIEIDVPLWAHDPGACRVDAHCSCQNLPATCDGSYACVSGHCTMICKAPCDFDSQCSAGSVCELESPTCDEASKRCMPGCHGDDDCGANRFCAKSTCSTCSSCPGTCRPACGVDGDCPAGNVCDYVSFGSPARACFPGCHQSDQCGSDHVCPSSAKCVGCVGCPCVRQCEPAGVVGCDKDADCSAGMVCETGPNCGLPKACILGCHESAQCGTGRTCLQVQCFTCPCPGDCI